MLVTSIISLALVAASAFASQSSRERFAARTARRSLSPAPVQGHAKTAGTSSSAVDYDDNWAGAVYFSPNNTYEGVYGIFVLPEAVAPPGANFSSLPPPFYYYAATAWVGVDGADAPSCGTIWQTGVDFYVFSNGNVNYYAWSEWYPAPMNQEPFDNMVFSAGDTVSLNIITTNATSGYATVRNLSNGQSVTVAASGQPALCRANAEWIVEDFGDETSGQDVPFANFTTVKFTSASAQLVSGGTVGPGGATLIDIEKNGQVITSASVTNSTVTIKYV